MQLTKVRLCRGESWLVLKVATLFTLGPSVAWCWLLGLIVLLLVAGRESNFHDLGSLKKWTFYQTSVVSSGYSVGVSDPLL